MPVPITLSPKKIDENKNFIGRNAERELLHSLEALGEPCIVVVYGRRRVGKTELVEQTFRQRHILKFEGLEGVAEQGQIQSVLYQLSQYADNPLIKQLNIKTWLEIFDWLADQIQKGKWTLYLEEIQWMADYSDKLISQLKYVWDNKFKNNKNLILVLCGSSPSFAINHILGSKALYNRTQYELPLHEFSLGEVRKFLGENKSSSEVMDAYLMVGGIPEYLKYLKTKSSVFLSLCEHSFKRGAFFAGEYKRIFVSSLAANPDYEKIIQFLGNTKQATRDQIARFLKLKAGGNLTKLLEELEICGFIEHYVPYQAEEKSILSRYCIQDQYLQFYFKFIHPIRKRIANGDYQTRPTAAVNKESLRKWMGFAFERFCRKHHRLFAKIIGFSDVQYRYGSFFNRSTQKVDPGFQMDIVYDRQDKVQTLCEIKYCQTPVGPWVIDDMQKKMDLFPKDKKKTIQKILIAPFGATEEVMNRACFDRIITLEEIF